MEFSPTELVYDAKGVLLKNTNIRNNTLKMNNGKYSQYTEELSPAIGEEYDIRDFKNRSDIKNGKSLSTYTYDGDSEYSRQILFDYGFSDHKQFSVVSPSRRQNIYFPDERNYLTLVNNLYGEDGTIVSYVDALLKGLDPYFIMHPERVGVVEHVNVDAALKGVITTNPNYTALDKIVTASQMFGEYIWNGVSNGEFDASSLSVIDMKNTDTKLGFITNYMYANALKYGSEFNSSRRRYDGEYRYITPELYKEYGNNNATIQRLSDILWLDDTYGRVRDDLGNSAKIINLDSYQRKEVNEDEIIAKYGNSNIKYYLALSDNNLITFGKEFDVEYKYRIFKSENYVRALGNGFRKSLYDEVFDGLNFQTNYKDIKQKIADTLSIHFAWDEGEGIIDGNNSTPLVDNGGNRRYEFDIYIPNGNAQQGIDHEHSPIGENNLLAKTLRMFKEKKIDTMVARFHLKPEGYMPSNDSAYDADFGNSHGRSLKKLGAKSGDSTLNINGYFNPYCRTWTFHHQYERYKRAIRPFIKDENTPYKLEEIQDNVRQWRPNGGSSYLGNYSVLQDNGRIKIEPHIDKAKENIYMLSIENLAWKDVIDMEDPLRKGPNGGRIMWFPPYDINFQENVSVQWQENSFIGRGEKVFTYANTSRQATLGFTILIDHPSVIDRMRLSNYQGKGPDNDPDADILRYFAGCEPFEFKNELGLTGPNVNEPQKTDSQEERVAANPDKIVFYVYFPNNYSGNWSTKGANPSDTTYTIPKNGCTDSDWYKYLCFGVDAYTDEVVDKDFPNDYPAPRGYETTDLPITRLDIGQNNIEEPYFIPACNRKCIADMRICRENNPEKLRRYRYRVDFDLRQNNKGISNDLASNTYADGKSYHYNSRLNSVYTDATNTFTEFLSAMNKDNQNYRKLCENENAVDELIKKLNEREIDAVFITGYATNQDPENADALALRRGNAALTLVSGMPKLMEKIKSVHHEVLKQPNLKMQKDITQSPAKLQRCAKVEIVLKTNETIIKNNNNQHIPTPKDSAEIAFNDLERIGYYLETLDRLGDKLTYEGNTDRKRGQYAYDKSLEYEYFKNLEVNDPFVFKQIKQKYNYFDPAFHSMTPEGFNARLNFLHQCTRQANTISASDTNDRPVAATAGNLAFGRMPVCVLRIGDFINSRVIINSMSITYSTNGTQWDLNPEGVGVQPNFAKVNLNVTLLGGSSLKEPINLLQNAQSFEYYANTGVYDNRANRESKIVADKVTYSGGNNSGKNEVSETLNVGSGTTEQASSVKKEKANHGGFLGGTLNDPNYAEFYQNISKEISFIRAMDELKKAKLI